ncbi:MAG: hypothetical protein ACFFCZ_11640 [Promethearchaeota archaeon]
MTFSDIGYIFFGLIVAIIVVVLLYGIAHWLQIAKFEKTALKQQLYQSGETVVPQKRRYLEQTFVWLSYFSTAHVIGFMLATLLVLTAVGVVIGVGTGINLIYPLIYFVFVAFAILTLARQLLTSEVKA